MVISCPWGDRRAVDRLDDTVTPEAMIRNPRATVDPQDGTLDRNSNALDLAVSNPGH